MILLTYDLLIARLYKSFALTDIGKARITNTNIIDFYRSKYFHSGYKGRVMTKVDKHYYKLGSIGTFGTIYILKILVTGTFMK